MADIIDKIDSQLLNDHKIVGRVVDSHLKAEQERASRGYLGNFLGNRESIPYNVSAILLIIAGIVLIFCAAFWAGDASYTKKDGIAALTSIVTLTLGYLFGRAAKA